MEMGMKRKDWEEMANEHGEYRVFLEFADANYVRFQKYLEEQMKKIQKGAKL